MEKCFKSKNNCNYCCMYTFMLTQNTVHSLNKLIKDVFIINDTLFLYTNIVSLILFILCVLFKKMLRNFKCHHYKRKGKKVWCEKMGSNFHYIPEIETFY